MKVRIIKTDEGYVPQVFFDPWFNKSFPEAAKPKWFSVGGSNVTYWSDSEFVMMYCTYRFLWRAKGVLNKFAKANKEYTFKFDKFESQLKEPNVVYEAEV